MDEKLSKRLEVMENCLLALTGKGKGGKGKGNQWYYNNNNNYSYKSKGKGEEQAHKGKGKGEYGKTMARPKATAISNATTVGNSAT